MVGVSARRQEVEEAVRFDTADLPLADRVDFWRSSMADQFLPMMVEPGRVPLRATVTGHCLAQTRMRTLQATSNMYARRACDIAEGDPGVLHLLLVDRGQFTVEQDGRESAAKEGDLLFYDSSRPFVFTTAGTSRSVICLLPKVLLPVPGRAIGGCVARPVPSAYGAAAAAGALLSTLARTSAGVVDHHQKQALQEAMVSMYVALLADEKVVDAPASVHFTVATAFIGRHLRDPDLGPDRVASACNVSPSYLHRIFSREGTTVARHIRDQRLAGAHRDLSLGGFDLPIEMVARKWGIADPSQFSRMFKRRFGQTPSDVRDGARRVHPVPGDG